MNTQSSTIVKHLWTCGCSVLRDERWLSVVGEVESAVEVGLARASRLRHAVPFGDDMLRSALEGRLP